MLVYGVSYHYTVHYVMVVNMLMFLLALNVH